MKIRELIQEEFRAGNLLFSYPEPELFYCSQCCTLTAFAIYRVFTSVFTIASLLEYIIVMPQKSQSSHHVMAYLSTWAYIVLTLHFSVSAVITVRWRCAKREQAEEIKSSAVGTKGQRRDDYTKQSGRGGGETLPHSTARRDNSMNAIEKGEADTVEDRLPWYLKVSWLLYETAFIISAIVSLVYFTSIFPKQICFESMNIHAINFFLVSIDVSLCLYPVRLAHCVYPAFLCILYLVFNVSYWAKDPTRNVLYPGMMDWKDYTTAILLVAIITFLLIPLFHALHFALYRLKSHYCKGDKWCRTVHITPLPQHPITK